MCLYNRMCEGDQPVRCQHRSFVVVMCRGGDVACFDVLRLAAG